MKVTYKINDNSVRRVFDRVGIPAYVSKDDFTGSHVVNNSINVNNVIKAISFNDAIKEVWIINLINKYWI